MQGSRGLPGGEDAERDAIARRGTVRLEDHAGHRPGGPTGSWPAPPLPVPGGRPFWRFLLVVVLSAIGSAAISTAVIVLLSR